MNQVFMAKRRDFNEEFALLIDKLKSNPKSRKILEKNVFTGYVDLLKVFLDSIDKKAGSEKIFWSERSNKFFKADNTDMSASLDRYYAKKDDFYEVTYNSGLRWKSVEHILLSNMEIIPFIFSNLFECEEYTKILNNTIKKYSENHNFNEVLLFSNDIYESLNLNKSDELRKEKDYIFSMSERFMYGDIKLNTNLYINGKMIKDITKEDIGLAGESAYNYFKKISQSKGFAEKEKYNIDNRKYQINMVSAVNDYNEYLSFFALEKTEELTTEQSEEILDEIIVLNRSTMQSGEIVLKQNKNMEKFLYKMLSENYKSISTKFVTSIDQQLRNIIEDKILDDKGKYLMDFKEEFKEKGMKSGDNYQQKIVLGKVAVKKFFPNLHRVKEISTGLFQPIFKIMYGDEGLEVFIVSKNKITANKEFLQDLSDLVLVINSNQKDNASIIKDFYRMLLLKEELNNSDDSGKISTSRKKI